MKNRIILHNVKKIIPKTKIQKKPIKSIRPVSMKKFHKNQLIIMQNKAITTRRITGIPINQVNTNIRNTNMNTNALQIIKKDNVVTLNNSEIHSIYNKIITTLNNKMNNSEFTNDEDLLLITYYNELTELKKEIGKLN